MDSLRNAAHGAFKKAAEAVLPPLTKSQFEEKRVRLSRLTFRFSVLSSVSHNDTRLSQTIRP